eukprot:TRINITY_DN5691_c0_g2_i1.p1 TRINITY_DN5691_c0_g2~~TRINITY_DN5691_c0_g2_i1.p1  ORF type:complete len:118 (-),score=18.82 TRINITY_DN5691_c0_g2_i1:166-519(-)
MTRSESQLSSRYGGDHAKDLSSPRFHTVSLAVSPVTVVGVRLRVSLTVTPRVVEHRAAEVDHILRYIGEDECPSVDYRCVLIHTAPTWPCGSSVLAFCRCAGCWVLGARSDGVPQEP